MPDFPARAVASALSAVGLSADADPVAYGRHLGGPGETDAMCHAMATFYDPKTGAFSSTCGLEVRACRREAGDTDPRMRAPYTPGTVITVLLASAGERGALLVLHLADPLPELQSGDELYVDCDASHRDGHTYRLLADAVAQPDGTWRLETVDGGHGAPGHQATVRRCKTLRRGVYGGWYDQADDGGPSRLLTHVVRAAVYGAAVVADVEPADASLDGSGA